MPQLRLTDEGEQYKHDFETEMQDSSCSCHISPPCAFCLHPGNPANLDANDSLWEPDTLPIQATVSVAPDPPSPSRYIGDAVYANYDGYQIWLRTGSHQSTESLIALDPNVLVALCEYAWECDMIVRKR